jgi:hypothetical protein
MYQATVPLVLPPAQALFTPSVNSEADMVFRAIVKLWVGFRHNKRKELREVCGDYQCVHQEQLLM